MKSTIKFLVSICFVYFSSCIETQKENIIVTNSKALDTLEIGYLNKILVGKRLFPAKDSKDILDNQILLFFKSENHYFAFYNKKKEVKILSTSYWEHFVPAYINFSIEDGLLSYTRFNKIDYFDPYLTGFYNSKDSIIITGSNLDIKDLHSKNQLRMKYLSISDTLISLDKNIKVGKSIDSILIELGIPNNINLEQNSELVLMEATSVINNAWYNDFPEYSTDYTVGVILSILNNKISRIQYIDSEYLDLIFSQRNISTEDIHYH